MDKITIAGTCLVVQDKLEFPSGFTKQVLVVDTGGQYPQQVPIEFVNDKTQLIENLQPGQDVEVGINIRGNEYHGKYYVNLQGWRVETSGQAPAPAPVQEDVLEDEGVIPF